MSATVAALGGNVAKYEKAMQKGGFDTYEQMLAELELVNSPEAQQLYNETMAEKQAIEEKRPLPAAPPAAPAPPRAPPTQTALWDNAVANDRKALRDEAERARRERDEAQARLYNERFVKATSPQLKVLMPWDTTNYDDIVDYVKKERLKNDVIRELSTEKVRRSVSPRTKTKAKTKPRASSKKAKPKAKSPAKKKKTAKK